jgi:TonB-linked SusC/RagA family outer membrane protein
MPRGTYLGDINQGYAYMGNIRNFDYLSESTLNYSNTFKKKHSVNAVAGYTWQSWRSVTDGVNAGGFPNDNLTYYNFGSASKVSTPQSASTEWSLASFLGRINYVFDRKYLITLTARADGSTRLAPGKKWDLFPSVALGWNMHNEGFIRNIAEINELKLRASYGVSGNQSIGVGSTLSRYGNNTGVMNETMTTVYYPANMPNSTLGWENTKQFNAGLDISLFSSRITFSSNYYYKLTSNLLINLPVPASTGYTQYATNSGEVSNDGLEFDFGARILTGKLKWKLNANVSFNQNKVLRFDGTMNSFMGPGFSIVNNQPLHIAKVGYPIGAFYGYVIDGIYQTQEEINQGPVDPANPRPGSFKFADISGPNGVPDGLISSYDRKVIGNPYPDYIFGVTNDLSWKNFSLNVFIQGSIGQDVINVNRFYLDALTKGTGSNVGLEAYQNRWTGPGSSNIYPVPRANSLPFEGRFTNLIVEDASFIRLKSVTLSYLFDQKMIKPIRSLKVFVTANNLLTLTNYKGYDPEVNAQGQNSLTPGVDLGTIPQFRTFSGGFNISF